jgi:hypothetical protein
MTAYGSSAAGLDLSRQRQLTAREQPLPWAARYRWIRPTAMVWTPPPFNGIQVPDWKR